MATWQMRTHKHHTTVPLFQQSKRTQAGAGIALQGGEAIAEIDQSGNVYELHNDYLGSPRYITNGNINQSTTGKIVGEQAFGPYGERMTGTFKGKTLPSGYKPITGYTGHINEDLTGLIYMRGRYYSPLWHRFINSDQGVDPNSINQFAYVNGRPFMASDPSGMETWCMFKVTTISFLIEGHWVDMWRFVELLYCWETGGGSEAEKKEEGYDPLCKELKELGITNENFEKMKNDMTDTLINQSQTPGYGVVYEERGHTFTGGVYYDGKPSTDVEDYWFGTGSWAGTILNSAINLASVRENPTGYSIHTHTNVSDWQGVNWQAEPVPGLAPSKLSNGDLQRAWSLPQMSHFMGWDGGLVRYNGLGVTWNLAGSGWWKTNCEGYLD